MAESSTHQHGSNRGNFAENPDRAAKAGRKAHEMGTAHEFTSEEARDAVQKRNQNR